LGRTNKYSNEFKVEIVEHYRSGRKTMVQLEHEYGICIRLIRTWNQKYEFYGAQGFNPRIRNASYTREFKEMVVRDYLSGADSTYGLSIKYGIPAHSTIYVWTKQYNGHEELKDYDPKGAIYMTPSRKTTFEERIEIVKYCLDHQRSYKLAAEHYDVAYAQVYQWVKKYEEAGEVGLVDRRGIHKTSEELSELELLKRENERLKQQLELKERETILLKKVKEFERRGYSPKSNKNQNI